MTVNYELTITLVSVKELKLLIADGVHHSFPSLSTYHRLVERLLRKRTLKTLLLPLLNSNCRLPEVACDKISVVVNIVTEANQWAKFHGSGSCRFFLRNAVLFRSDGQTDIVLVAIGESSSKVFRLQS